MLVCPVDPEAARRAGRPPLSRHELEPAGAATPSTGPSRPRTSAAAMVCAVLFGGIVGVFWQQDLQFSRPTPVPEGWVPIATGTVIALPPRVEAFRRNGGPRPLLLHFFNPACPCSRFNLDHVRALVRTYGDRVTFVAVLSHDVPARMVAAYQELHLGMPYYVDDGRLAAAVGTYSTPQAAVLDGQGRLTYRGNYNVTRYCRDRETEFARLAIEVALSGGPAPPFSTAATTPYGCPLRKPLGRTPRTGEGA